jgi:hypothetical protein
MFWMLAIVFWFILVLGTHVTGNAAGNWIALAALFLMVRSRRRAARQTASVAAAQPATPTPASAATASSARFESANESTLALRQLQRGTPIGRAPAHLPFLPEPVLGRSAFHEMSLCARAQIVRVLSPAPVRSEMRAPPC